MRIVLISVAFLLTLRATACCNAASPEAGNLELRGKVFCGYQGWFSAPGDGTGLGFDNYNYGGLFRPGVCVIDYWPEVSEFDDDEKYPTDFRHSNGTVAHVYSAANPKTVNRHFRWMKDYGIDGVFLQRFGWALKHPRILRHRDEVLKNVRQSAFEQNRLWALMYDLTSLKAGDIGKYVIPDIRRLVEAGGLANDPAYARYRERPLIGIWGVGFDDNRAYSLSECQDLVEFLKHDPVYGGNSVLLGVPYHWQSQKHDAVADSLFHEIVRQADIVSPWSIGRYRTVEQASMMVRNQLKLDVAWTKQHGLGYLPVIFPGFSWCNLGVAKGAPKPLNEIPRAGGRFFWAQAKEVKNAGLDMIYVAMFDEMNEGTCVFKCAADPPVGNSSFLSYDLDGLTSDYYLWLTGQVARLMRGEIATTTELPERLSH